MFNMCTCFKFGFIFSFIFMLNACTSKDKKLAVTIFETAENGSPLHQIMESPIADSVVGITLLPDQKFQTITGFGGSFTEASASLLNKLSKENRDKILEAYFGDTGARYSLTRTHINSCDFSLGHYAYAPVADDTTLSHFSIEEDRNDIIPMIKDAMAISSEANRV